MRNLRRCASALDKASTDHQIELLGNDGHHGAFNSPALAAAKGFDGKVIGLSKATLNKEFADLQEESSAWMIAANPMARSTKTRAILIDVHAMLNSDLAEVAKAPERVAQRLNSVGITAIMDAMASPDSLPVYDALQARGQFTMRAVLAQFLDPERFKRANGRVDFDAMVEAATTVRAKYAKNDLIRADFVKLFADGVLEGNPLAVPPTLPNAASLRPYSAA